MGRSLACLWALFAATPSAAQEPVQRALLIGIERYPAELEWHPLRGARADAEALRDVLIARVGFEAENITLLLDEQATREAILTTFAAMAKKAGPEDVLLLYFAGHGSQLPDEDGDELDGLDETLVPYDAAPPGQPPRDLRDDDVRAAIMAANESTPHVVLIFDCCSSGTVTRGHESLTSRGVPILSRGIEGVRPSLEALQSSSGYSEPGPTYVALSACRAHEPAYEVEVPGGDELRHRGLFTHCLVQELEHGVGLLTYDEVLAGVRRRVRRTRPEQTPVIEGPLRTRTLFSHGLPARSASYLISARTGRVRAGTLNGLASGALLGVFHPTQDPDVELGRVRLEKVGTISSTFTWVGNERPQGTALAARLVDPGPNHDPLDVALIGEDPQLRAAVDAAPRIRRVAHVEAELVLRREEHDWNAYSVAGTRLPLRARAGDAEQLALLLSGLDRLATARAIEANVSREGGAVPLVATAVERLDEHGISTGPLERDAGGIPIVRPGDAIGARLTNLAPVGVYASLLVISPDGAVTLVQAPENEDDVIPPGATVRTIPLEVYVDADSAPFYRDGFDCLRWVVTRRFHDLRSLEQRPATDLSVHRGDRTPDPAGAREQLAGENWATSSTELRVIEE